ncbi:MAG: hypothetical protein ACOYU0_08755 [Nitrospirota bacterium]
MKEIVLSSEDIAHTIYAGIRHPMTVGDKASVEKELLDIKEERKDIEVFICDITNEITYTTHKEKLKSNLANHIYKYNKDALQALRDSLKTGEHLPAFFEEKTSTGRYLIYVHLILNNKDCYHCHGSSRKVLGSMVIKINTEQTLADIASTRNHPC